MGKDWIDWHREYDEPDSSLARRLQVVQDELRAALGRLRRGPEELRLISMCAGDGRDVLPVMAENPGSSVRALLVELDPILTDRIRVGARALGLSAIEVATADAGVTDQYLRFGPAHVVLACGVFGNVTIDDAERTISTLPSLLADDGVVIWTRGRGDDGPDLSQHIRQLFADHGFVELGFTAPTDARFRVGAHRLAFRSTASAPLRAGDRMFTFVR